MDPDQPGCQVVAELVHEHQHAKHDEKCEGTLQHGGHGLACFRFS